MAWVTPPAFPRSRIAAGGAADGVSSIAIPFFITVSFQFARAVYGQTTPKAAPINAQIGLTVNAAYTQKPVDYCIYHEMIGFLGLTKIFNPRAAGR
ncbi:MAG: hypothetical protein WBG88_11870 [Mesorhizobium sp.]